MKATLRLAGAVGCAVAMVAAAPSARAQAADELASHTRVSALVPADMATRDACAGLRSLDECTAVLHAAQNLNIPFATLRDRVTGGASLESAIHSFRPRADSRREVRRAQAQAREDLRPLG